jgi:hypothetical protein
VPAHTRPRREPHVAERLGAGGVDCTPDVDAQRVGEDGQLVDEGDVHVPEGVLEQLDQLGLGRRAHGHDLVDQRPVERLDAAPRRFVDARHHLGRVHEAPAGVAGVDALGRVAEEELPGLEARALLEQRPHQLVGGAGIGRRLEHDQRAGPQPAGQGGRRVLDVRQVGRAVAQRRRDRDHGDVERPDVSGVAHRAVAGPQRAAELVVGDVGHVRVAGLQGGGPVGRRLEPDHVEADLDRPHRHGQTDVALPDDEHAGRALLELAEQLGGEPAVGGGRGRRGARLGCRRGSRRRVGHRLTSCEEPAAAARVRNHASVWARPSAKLVEGV